MDTEPGEGIKSNPELLRDVVSQEAIQTDDQLRESSLRGFKRYFFSDGKLSEHDSLALIFDESRRQRVYLLRKLLRVLYPNGEVPANAVEVGSAGDISFALAFPNVPITSVDIDPDIFLNVPYNSLPEAFLNVIGKSRKLEGYGRPDLLGRKRRKLEIVQEALPNWIPLVEDASDMSAKDGTYELALAQGTPDMLEFIEEMARVIRIGGYIVSMVEEQIREGEFRSAYKQERYNFLPEYAFVPDTRLAKLGLERVLVPNRLKKYELLGAVSKSGDDEASTGYVFEIFKKVA